MQSHYLTHWGRATHICVSKLTIIGSDNGLLPGRRQAIIWTNAGILLIQPLGTNFSEILIRIQTFSFKIIHLKVSSEKWRPFCLGLNVLKATTSLMHVGITRLQWVQSCVKSVTCWNGWHILLILVLYLWGTAANMFIDFWRKYSSNKKNVIQCPHHDSDALVRPVWCQLHWCHWFPWPQASSHIHDSRIHDFRVTMATRHSCTKALTYDIIYQSRLTLCR